MTITDSINAVGNGSVLGTGARGTFFVVFGGEIGAMLLDMRWGIILLLLLIVADFRFGWSESKKRYRQAKKKKDELRKEMYRWHTSRAFRRTWNKLADYIVMMLVCGALGMAVFEPLGIEHIWGAWIGAVMACICEVVSICGHFFYLHGVRVERKSVTGFLKALAVAFAKKKDSDIGESLEEAFNQTEEKSNE